MMFKDGIAAKGRGSTTGDHDGQTLGGQRDNLSR